MWTYCIDDILDNWILSSVLMGIRCVYGTVSKHRLPMAIDILIAIHSKLNLSSTKQVSFWANCLTMLLGLFWKSHLLPTSHPTFYLNQQFLRSNFMYNIRFLVKLLCRLFSILHAFSLISSAVPTSKVLCFQMCSFQTSRFTYRSFMAMLKETLLLIRFSLKDYHRLSFRWGEPPLP